MPVLDVVIPVYNEEAGLDRSVRIVHAFLRDSFPYPARLTIADNASTDGTLAIARTLARDLDGVRVLHLEEKGRGRTLHRAWLESDALVLAYMDVGLSTDLAALLPLVAPLVSGHSHIAIGSRLTRSSHVTRGPKREVVSRAYNLLLRGTLRTHFSDAQCGVKAIWAGGLLDATTPSEEVLALLLSDAGSNTWVAATVGANNAAGFQLATQESVMPIGGFNGSDPSPTLAQFQQYVAEGKVHYFIAGGLGVQGRVRQGMGGSDAAQEIAAWVEETSRPPRWTA